MPGLSRFTDVPEGPCAPLSGMGEGAFAVMQLRPSTPIAHTDLSVKLPRYEHSPSPTPPISLSSDVTDLAADPSDRTSLGR